MVSCMRCTESFGCQKKQTHDQSVIQEQFGDWNLSDMFYKVTLEALGQVGDMTSVAIQVLLVFSIECPLGISSNWQFDQQH